MYTKVGSRNARTHYQRTALQHLRRRRAAELCVARDSFNLFANFFFFFFITFSGWKKKCEL